MDATSTQPRFDVRLREEAERKRNQEAKKAAVDAAGSDSGTDLSQDTMERSGRPAVRRPQTLKRVSRSTRRRTTTPRAA
ncbi:hypothetical protein [Kibdelosporangium philippinense]|uniref:hypothetical protein n=1 Tax=Kibdelosporangium philippinense TaxID=211113 RepID=UPI003610B640